MRFRARAGLGGGASFPGARFSKIRVAVPPGGR
jgi:hypothetical protein